MRERLEIFRKNIEGVGSFSLVEYDNDVDFSIIHPWVNMAYASFWMLNNSSLFDVKNEYDKILSTGHTKVFLGFFEGEPVFLTELYEPQYEEIGKHFISQSGDRGMHVLVGPPEKHIPNFSSGVFATIMSFVFDYYLAKRVIVEPDIRNTKIHKLNEKFGFIVLKDRVELSNKVARLEMCTRLAFETSGQAHDTKWNTR
jgi:hypothetical protein